MCKALTLFNMARYTDVIAVGEEAMQFLPSCHGLNLPPFLFHPHMVFAHLAVVQRYPNDTLATCRADVESKLAPHIAEVDRLYSLTPLNSSFIWKLVHGNLREV